MRNVRERNRWRERTVASLGKHYSTAADPNADTDPNAKSFTISLTNIDSVAFTWYIDNSIAVALGNICVSDPESQRQPYAG